VTDLTATTRNELGEAFRIRLAGYALAFLALPVFALWAVLSGKEASWDFQNYHWYDPYALLNGRLGFDIAVAHHATYYNPFLDVPLFLLGSHFPGWVGGASLGLQAGVAAALIGAVAYRLFPFEHKPTRLVVSVVFALIALTGGGARGEIGKTTEDIASGLGAIASLFVLIACFERVMRAEGRDLLIIAFAGFLGGASPGLKLTALPYAVGLGIGVLALPGSWRQRMVRTGVFGLGMALGVAVCGGPWYWMMWRYSGNPVFPYFNDLFKSPLVGPGSFRDENFLPKGWFAKLFYPFLFSKDSMLVAEWKFRDIHVLLAYITVPVAAICALFRRPTDRQLVDPIKARLLLVMAAVTYLVWVNLFGIYRYLVPLEILSGVVIAASVALIPIPAWQRIAAIVALLGIAQIMAWKGDEPRYAWDSTRYVEVNVPPIEDPDHTLILLSQTAPLGYTVPYFPKQIPFYRIQGWMVGSKDTQSELGAEMHRRVAEHKGPILALYWGREETMVPESYADYGLELDKSGCRRVTTNIESELSQGYPILLCPLKRIAS
jgi:hypothetical protein